MQTTCGIFLIDNQDRMLIVHPTNHPNDHWTIPKGLRDVGESDWDAAKRELQEETGIDLDYLTYKKEYMGYIPYGYKNKTLSSFLVKCENTLSTKTLHCDSLFMNKEYNMKQPEVDGFELVNKDIAVQVIQEEQKTLWDDYHYGK